VTLLDLILPAKCVNCDRIGARICSICETEIGTSPRLVFRSSLVGFAADSYGETSKKLLRAFKELGEFRLAQLIAKSMVGLLDCFEETFEQLLPIPSSQTSLTDRGFNPAVLIAREVSKLRPEFQCSDRLLRTREVADQSKLKPGERFRNQSDSMKIFGDPASLILIDDVVTTGATLVEAAKTAEAAGNRVVGFLTFAETESKKV
jgi:ComF family protein